MSWTNRRDWLGQFCFEEQIKQNVCENGWRCSKEQEDMTTSLFRIIRCHGCFLSPVYVNKDTHTQTSWERLLPAPVEITIDAVTTLLASSKQRVIHLELGHYKTYHMDIENPIKTMPHLLVSRSVVLSFLFLCLSSAPLCKDIMPFGLDLLR